MNSCGTVTKIFSLVDMALHAECVCAEGELCFFVQDSTTTDPTSPAMRHIVHTWCPLFFICRIRVPRVVRSIRLPTTYFNFVPVGRGLFREHSPGAFLCAPSSLRLLSVGVCAFITQNPELFVMSCCIDPS